jgi:PH/SEC7 domain-containing protein
MYASIKAQPIFQPSSGSLAPPESRSSLSLGPTSPYGTWAGVTRASSRRSQQSTNGSERGSGAYKRSSIRGFLSTAPSTESISRAASPTPSAFSETYSGATSFTSAPQIGFASNLSHTIIREQQEDDLRTESGDDVDDEELALMGAPWAKEGILQRKHYWEAENKRSKDRSWATVFVVIQRGELRMFKFGNTGGPTRFGGVGGGNWMVRVFSFSNFVYFPY